MQYNYNILLHHTSSCNEYHEENIAPYHPSCEHVGNAAIHIISFKVYALIILISLHAYSLSVHNNLMVNYNHPNDMSHLQIAYKLINLIILAIMLSPKCRL